MRWLILAGFLFGFVLACMDLLGQAYIHARVEAAKA